MPRLFERTMFGDAEVEQFGARRCQHDVRGLHIAMNEAGAMRVPEGSADLDANAKDLSQWQRSTLKSPGQRFAIQELHDEELCAGILTEVIERTNVRVIEDRDRARLSVESRTPEHSVFVARAQHFDGHDTIEAGVERAVNLAHASAAETLDEPICAKQHTRPDARFTRLRASTPRAPIR
jgi:hypothetical protein